MESLSGRGAFLQEVRRTLLVSAHAVEGGHVSLRSSARPRATSLLSAMMVRPFCRPPFVTVGANDARLPIAFADGSGPSRPGPSRGRAESSLSDGGAPGLNTRDHSLLRALMSFGVEESYFAAEAVEQSMVRFMAGQRLLQVEPCDRSAACRSPGDQCRSETYRHDEAAALGGGPTGQPASRPHGELSTPAYAVKSHGHPGQLCRPSPGHADASPPRFRLPWRRRIARCVPLDQPGAELWR